VRVAHQRAAVAAEPRPRRDVRAALKTLHGRTLRSWASVGALSVTMELSTRIVSVAVPFRFAQSESCPAVRSKTLVSDDVMRRRGAGSGHPRPRPRRGTARAVAVDNRVADVGDGYGSEPAGRKTSANPHASAAAPITTPARAVPPTEGSHHRTPADKGSLQIGEGDPDRNSVAHAVGQALAPPSIVPIAAAAEVPKFPRAGPNQVLETAPPEVTRCVLLCALRSCPCSSPPAAPRPRRHQPKKPPPPTSSAG